MPSSLMDVPLRLPVSPVRLRPACAADAAALVQLAELLDTMNLPQDPGAIASIIAESEASFTRLAHPGPAHPPTAALPGTYTLVALQGEQLLGTASLLSHHGTSGDPHYYLRIIEQTFHSKQLNTERHLHLLRLERDEVPWTELGGLVVHPRARGKGLGKLLVAARLLLVAMHPAHFCQRLLAELLPPQREDGSNAFWDALGGPLTGLNYYRADLLCRTDKEFINALFPRHEVVLELMPPEAQIVVGQVGPATVPVCHILRRAGFQYLGTVDPFDGGPHYGARVQEVQPIQRSRALVCLDLPPAEMSHPVLLGNPLSHCFLAAPAEVCRHGIRLDKSTAELLDLHPGDLVWHMPLDW
jgi:arginine N-succinyltransferase